MNKVFLLKHFAFTAALACLITPTTATSASRAVKTAGAVATATIVGGLGRYFYKQNEYGNPPLETLKFAWEGLKPGNKVGTIMPCSRYLGETLTAKLPTPVAGVTHRFLEAGAGTGTVSTEILKKMEQNDTLDLVELEESLCKILRDKFKDDKRVTVHCASILDFKPGYTYDAIVTTIPFNDAGISTPLVKHMWDTFIKLVKDDGVVSYVNYCFPPKFVALAAKVGLYKKTHAQMQATNGYLDKLHAQSGDGFTIEKRNYPDIRIRYFKFNKANKQAGLALTV